VALAAVETVETAPLRQTLARQEHLQKALAAVAVAVLLVVLIQLVEEVQVDQELRLFVTPFLLPLLLLKPPVAQLVFIAGRLFIHS
jgi:hypothetical protein